MLIFFLRDAIQNKLKLVFFLYNLKTIWKNNKYSYAKHIESDFCLNFRLHFNKHQFTEASDYTDPKLNFTQSITF